MIGNMFEFYCFTKMVKKCYYWSKMCEEGGYRPEADVGADLKAAIATADQPGNWHCPNPQDEDDKVQINTKYENDQNSPKQYRANNLIFEYIQIF